MQSSNKIYETIIHYIYDNYYILSASLKKYHMFMTDTYVFSYSVALWQQLFFLTISITLLNIL